MEFSSQLYDAQLRNVSTVCINSVRKEAWVGCKDGSIRGYDLNRNILKFRSREHSGLVVRILCWHSQRMMITVAIDGAIIFWSSGALATDKIYLGEPIFDAVIYNKKKLVVASKAGCKFFPLDSHKLTGHFILTDRVHTVCPHRDFIRSLAAQDKRVYSGGMDGTFVIYELLMHHSTELSPVHIIRKAHAAGILCIEVCKHSESDEAMFIATGSYDRHVKIWSNDGQLCHAISGFDNSITGMCYIRLTQQLWIASSAGQITIVDPRSGEDVSEWTEASQKHAQEYRRGKRRYLISFMSYSKELEVLVAQTDIHYLLHWFYNPLGCSISIPCLLPMESLAVTDKEPVLLFTGDSKGQVVKWEKAGLNTVKFANDKLVMQRKLKDAPIEWQNVHEPKEITDQHIATVRQQTPSTYLSPKFFSGKQSDEHDTMTTVSLKSPPQKMLWIENIDLLIVCDERGVIYAWGYEDVETHPEDFAKHYAESARSDSNILHNIRAATKPLSAKEPAGKVIRKRSIKTPKPVETVPESDTIDSSRSRSTLLSRSTVDSSSVDMDIRVHTAMTDWQTYKHYLNRASGFFCRFVLWGHDICVSGMDYVYDAQADQHILISASWDRRIITWDLMTGQIIDVCKRNKTEAKVIEEKETPGEYELVSEGQITDIAYSAKRNEVAYCSRDAHLYVRKFSTNGRKMKLLKKWHAHNGEVLQVRWIEKREAWLTSGQDGTIRIWSADDLGTRLAAIECTQPIQCLTIDRDYGWILVAAGSELQIYNPETMQLIRKHTGHQQLITGIYHSHHLYRDSHYITTSYDGFIKTWRACTRTSSLSS